MERPRILIIENSIDVTGALKSITRTAHDLKQYFDFQFVIPTGSRGRSWIEAKGFEQIHELPMREISKRFSSILLYLPMLFLNTVRLKQIVERENIDLIHVNDLYNLLPVTYYWLGGKKAYVCHVRFLPDRFPKALFDFWLKLHLQYSHKIVVVSNAVMKQVAQHDKITVIHNELPVEERYPDLVEQTSTKTVFRFLYLSNFMMGKGQNFALEAFARIHQHLPDWKVRFVGGDMGLEKNAAYRRRLQNKAQELGIFEKTEWAPFTEEVEREYKQADIVLNFSESESFSITCLEALFFGRPVIASNCGGPAELIFNNQTGLLVENKSVESMCSAMRQLANDFPERVRMGRLARQDVRIRFSIQNTSMKIRAIYDEILKK